MPGEPPPMLRPATRPAPGVDRDNAFFWDGLATGQLRLQCCTRCETHRFPPMPGCPRCGASETRIEVTPGAGSLYSWIVVHHAFSQAFADDVPYTIGVVELAEGCRMLARLELGALEPRIGMPLGVGFRAHAAQAAGAAGEHEQQAWTEAFFEPEATPVHDADG